VPAGSDHYCWYPRIGALPEQVDGTTGIPDEFVQGTGIRVDPWHVLTCAHVVDDVRRVMPPGGRLAVEFVHVSGRPVRTAREVYRPPEAESAREHGRREYRLGDLALLMMDGPGHPEELEGPARVEHATFAVRHPPEEEFVAVGYPRGWPDSEPIRVKVVDFRTRTTDGAVRLTGIAAENDGEEIIRKGFSGGPVIHRSTGQVVGMVTKAVLKKASGSSLMLPWDRIAEYLAPFIDVLPMEPVLPQGARELRGLLTGARLTAPEQAYAWAVQDGAAATLMPGPEAEVLRAAADDPYTLLRWTADNHFGEAPERTGELLARLLTSVDGVDRAALERWAATHLRTPLPERPGPGTPVRLPRVTIKIRDSGKDNRGVSIEVVAHAGQRPLHTHTATAPKWEDAKRHVGEPFRRALEDLETHHSLDEISERLRVEFNLPQGQLSAPVDEWVFDGTGSPDFGHRYPVVVWSDDLDGEIGHEQMRLRRLKTGNGLWQEHLVADPAKCVLAVPCRHELTRPDDRIVANALDERTWVQALVIGNLPPKRTEGPLLSAALYGGMPVMVWRRKACQDKGNHVDCPGTAFAEQAAEQVRHCLRTAGIHGLPAVIYQLRRGQPIPGGPQADACREHLTLYWNPPDRPRRPRLESATPQGEGT
jgi:hypothetical protein